MGEPQALFADARQRLAPHFVTLGKPAVDVALAPDTARSDFAEGLREPDLAGELVGALPAQPEGGGDLCDAHEFHENEFTGSLDRSKGNLFNGATDADRPRTASTAGGMTQEGESPMRDKRTQIVDQFESVIATAMDNGWTEVEIVADVRAMAAAESERRTQETARRLYSRSEVERPAPVRDRIAALDDPPTTKTTPEAAAIVAAAKLPKGAYGIANETGTVSYKGSAFDAVAAALSTEKPCRLYRNALGWRFVGVVHPDGRFVDERADRG